MDIPMTAVVGSVLAAVIILVIKGILEWINDRSTKKEFNALREEYDLKFKKLELELNTKLDKMENEFNIKLNSALSNIKDIKNSISEQLKEFNKLKTLIVSSYVTNNEFDKNNERNDKVRDIVMKHDTNITTISDSIKQNSSRMNRIESKITS